MDAVVLAVIAFIVYGYISALKQKTNRTTQRTTRRRLEEPWVPPSIPSTKTVKRPERPSPWGRENQGQPVVRDFDPFKEEELARSAGKEGEWGDEGRPAKEQKEPAIKVEKPLEQAAVYDSPQEIGYTADDIQRGIIWSEILGKPRALKPFRGPRA